MLVLTHKNGSHQQKVQVIDQKSQDSENFSDLFRELRVHLKKTN